MQDLHLRIPEQHIPFFLQLIEQLRYVEILDSDVELEKREILDDFREGLREVKLMEEGKLEGKDARDFLKSLDD